jgi:LEA14-like dessication related protein
MNDAIAGLKRRAKVFRTLALMAGAALSFAGCAALHPPDPPKVTVAGIEPAQGEGFEARMLLKLRVQNPNSAPIDFNGVYLELKVQGKGFASGVSDQSGTVPSFGEAVIDVPVTISIMGIVGQALGMIGGGKLPDKVHYEMNGKLNSPTSGALRFNSQGELALPTSLPADST